MTGDAYVAKFHTSPLSQAGGATEPASQGLTPALVPPGGTGSPGFFNIQFDTHDGSGRYMPTRYGDADLGWYKIVSKHNITSITVVTRIETDSGDVSGTRVTYDGYIVDKSTGRTILSLLAVGDLSHSTKFGTPPDGFKVGTLTAYCVGMTACPSWLSAQY